MQSHRAVAPAMTDSSSKISKYARAFRQSEPSSVRLAGDARLQAALVRAVLDEVEQWVPSSQPAEAPSAQLAEEVQRLGYRLLELAEALALEAGDPVERRRDEGSGVRRIWREDGGALP